jgi:amino acid adenylation domain-containing protein
MNTRHDNPKQAKDEKGVLVQHLFEDQVLRTPDAIAICLADQSLTYRELSHRSDQLCAAIIQEGLDSGPIGISTTRTLNMIVGLIAVLKSGHPYLPLDPAYPADRLKNIILDAGLELLLCLDSEKPLFQTLGISSVISLDQIPEAGRPRVEPIFRSSQAYVLYTSGSTGMPKGVCMGHEPMINLLEWQRSRSKAGRGTKTLQFTPISFDVSFQEIFSTLITGGTLVLISDDERLDPQRLLNFLESQSINRLFLPFAALQFLTETAAAAHRFPASLQEIMTAGEQLKVTPQLVRFFSALPDCTLYNQYGPTECHVVTELQLEGDPATWPALPTIGKPIDQVSIFILDEDLKALPPGHTGELCISGKCLAEGYLNRPSLTEEKFIRWAGPGNEILRLYRTGDLARYLPDGNIEFLGRRDDQVKVRGYRVEPGEIEVVINQQKGIQLAVVVAREDLGEQKKLIAYLVSSDGRKDTAMLRKSMASLLPDYMMPSSFVWLDELPKTSSGKIDKRALPKPSTERPDLAVLYKAPSSETEKRVSRVWHALLQLDKIGVDDNFFELGGNSLLAMKTVAELRLLFQYDLPITKLYLHPTIAGIASFLSGASKPASSASKKNRKDSKLNRDVAVIGMAGRFPGANSIEELWTVLRAGKETISFFSKEELDPQVPAEVRNDPDYVAARGILDHPDQFDAGFFGINPKAAQVMDPQQRIFLEISWEALERAGYVPSKYSGTIAVFAGTGNNTYYQNNVSSNVELIGQVGSFQVMTLNEKDYVATRTAYELDLKGPAVSLYSACSTSLLAIAKAAESIRDGECDMALAGGVAVTVPIRSGHVYQEGAMLSRDGHCRSFDADAQGTVFSDGAGVVVLKSLENALADGDQIFALIKGVGVNNDGGSKGSFTAPSAEGQSIAITRALEDADVDPSTITYLEAHGTATPLGDPIEMEGLNMAFGTQAAHQYCAIGSIKSNMGHLTAAAGVAGFIKTALSLFHRQIPPSVNFTSPNPNIDFARSPFYVNRRLLDWQSQGTRRAGVSSFGVGGTNVHLVLEEFETAPAKRLQARPMQLLSWSAKTEPSREAFGDKLKDYLSTQTDPNLPDLAYSLHTGRADFNFRRFLIAAQGSEAIEKLSAPLVLAESKKLDERFSDVVFMFPGQGAQFLNMGLELYRHEPVFQQAIDRCAAGLEPLLKDDIRKILFPAHLDQEALEKINNTYYTQPAIFTIEYAMASLWLSWGIQPMALIGHSIGEFVAAHLAQVFSLEDGLRLIAARSAMMAGLPAGSMLAVKADFQSIADSLPSDLSLAAINSPGSCVVAGPIDGVAEFGHQLEGRGISSKLLRTSHAFHSAMMDPILEPFERLVRSIKLSAPRIPIVSTVTGTWLTDAESMDPAYWTRHLRSPVRFADALRVVYEDGRKILLETGPGNVTTLLARQQAPKKSTLAFSSLDLVEGQSAYYPVLKALGQMWLNGIQPDWSAFYLGQGRKKLSSLPTYAFERKRYWVDPKEVVRLPLAADRPALQDAALHQDLENNVLQNNHMRKAALIDKVKAIVENTTGIDLEEVSAETGFMEIGLDSLLLTQVALNLKKEFRLPITFRQLTEEYGSLDLLASYLDRSLPQEKPQTPGVQVPAVAAGEMSASANITLLSQQIQFLAQQVALLQGSGPAKADTANPAYAPSLRVGADTPISPEEAAELKKPFGATARIEKKSRELNAKQQAFLNELIQRYSEKTKSSKAYTQQHRAYMADPRVVSGFRPQTKEIVYSIVVNKSKGFKLWDIDGNEYIDVLNGFGSNMFGYQPDFVVQALRQQIDKGFELGPQHELAGEVCKLIGEFTGFERVALCNTGSEAVLGAMRIARTVTGRSTIVAFSGSYHGIVDEVIVRGTKKLKSFPAAPGIMPEAVQNMLILDYGTDESLRIISERSQQIAAVLVEPVQSRRPEFQPIEFLKKLRQITEASGTALIFDEVITGFRMHPGGTQALFGIRADLGTYGKVVAAGMPFGVIAGHSPFMDALDGGYWQFGDQSVPESGVTYFAGTFVRHPLALAAAKASLEYMKSKGPGLQKRLTDLTQQLAIKLNRICDAYGLPLYAAQFGSLWKLKFKEDIAYSELLFTLMREKGIHILDGFPCFLNEAFSEKEVDLVVQAFESSASQLIQAGFLPVSKPQEKSVQSMDLQDLAPLEGARLGRDKFGNPAWFVTDPDHPGKYLQVN